MKLLRIGIRFWITLASLLSFAMGWVMLAHAPKPNPSSSANILTSLPALKPLNPLSNFDSDEENFQSQPSFDRQLSINSQFRPAFRTGGS